MTNPLIKKYDELYGPKKEEPKKVEYELPIEFKTAIGSTASVTCATGSNNWIPANNCYVTAKPKPIITYDTQSVNDVFLQIAEKVKDKTAVVTSVSMEIDQVGGFTTGLKTCTFKVNVYDTP